MTYRNCKISAFSMVELTLALGVAGFCFLAVLGLLPVGVQTNQRAISQTAATGIFSNVVADMRATPKASLTSTQYGVALSAGTPTTLYFDSQGSFATTLVANSRYRLVVTIPANPAGPNAATFAYLRVTWPAVLDPSAAPPPTLGGSSEMFAAMSRN